MKKLLVIFVAAILVLGFSAFLNSPSPLVGRAYAAAASTLADGAPAAHAANSISLADVPLPLQVFVWALVGLCVLLAVFPLFISEEETFEE